MWTPLIRQDAIFFLLLSRKKIVIFKWQEKKSRRLFKVHKRTVVCFNWIKWLSQLNTRVLAPVTLTFLSPCDCNCLRVSLMGRKTPRERSNFCCQILYYNDPFFIKKKKIVFGEWNRLLSVSDKSNSNKVH